MYKKFLATAILVCSLPVMANAAWMFNTQAKTAGGTINTPKLAGQTVANGNVFKTYTTHLQPQAATVIANPGYTITRIVRNGVTILNPASPYSTAVNGGAAGTTSQSLYATFQASKLSVTASVTDPTGGSVTPTSVANIFYGKQYIPIVFKFTPKPGYNVSAISGTAGFTVSSALPAAVGATVTVTIPANNVLTSAVNLVGTFATTAPSANAGTPQTVSLNTLVTLTGTSLYPAFQKWSSVSRPAGAAAIPTVYVNPTSFTPAVAGTYGFLYRVANTAAKTTSVTVTGSYAASARTQCYNCHAANGVGVASNTFSNWSGSSHKVGGITCYNCHSGANTGGHPGSTANACVGCHSSIAVHSVAASTCSQCHNSHSASTTHATTATSRSDCATCHVTETTATAAHYGGTAFLKAQYVSDASLSVSCANCHGGNPSANQALLRQYTSSAHGSPLSEAWRHYDWRGANRSACARCHNGSAFVAKLGNENNTTNVFQPGDILKPGETLACSACHTNTDTGALRTADQSFTINMTNGATVTYDVAGASTLCARCHSGRETGDSISADANVTGIRVFVDSHYQPAAVTLYNKGYDYGVNTDLGAHKSLGAATQGPCVTCHMPGKNHSFAAAACATCHNGTTAPVVDAATLKANYDTALNNLKSALAAKGIHYGPVHPYFFTSAYTEAGPNIPVTDWSAAYGAGNWKHTMGAAFNYNLFWSEKGAYAHNYSYAMKLIADSIDFMTDGSLGL